MAFQNTQSLVIPSLPRDLLANQCLGDFSTPLRYARNDSYFLHGLVNRHTRVATITIDDGAGSRPSLRNVDSAKTLSVARPRPGASAAQQPPGSSRRGLSLPDVSSHLHLAAETVTMDDLSAYMGKVCRRYTMYHHQKYGGSGPLWVRRFRSILVQKEGYLERLGRYIERNGLRAGLVEERPWEYRFCSAGAYVDGKDDGLVAVARHPVWGDLSMKQPTRRRSYAAFVLDEADAREDEPGFRSTKDVVGDDAFTANTRRDNGRPTSRGQGRHRLTGQ